MKYYLFKLTDYDENKIYNIGDNVLEKYIIKTTSTKIEKYTNDTSILGWSNIKFKDYLFIREQIKQCVDNFEKLSIQEKELLLEYCAYEPKILIEYIIQRDNKSQVEAYNDYLLYRSKDIKKASICFAKRLEKPELTQIIIKYLGMSGGEQFMNEIRPFVQDMKETAIIGTQYGNTRDGLLDYIESTSSYVDSGLKDYTITTGLTLEMLIKDLKNLILDGFVAL